MSATTLAAKADRLHRSGCVTERPTARVFNVRGDRATYVVVLDAEGDHHCSCPSTVGCSHILAAALAGAPA